MYHGHKTTSKAWQDTLIEEIVCHYLDTDRAKKMSLQQGGESLSIFTGIGRNVGDADRSRRPQPGVGKQDGEEGCDRHAEAEYDECAGEIRCMIRCQTPTDAPSVPATLK